MLKKVTSKNKFIAGMYRYCVACFLAALVAMFIALPLLEQLENGERITAWLLTIVLLFAVMAVGNSRRTFILAIVLVLPAMVGKWMNHLRPEMVPEAVFLIPALLFIMFVIVHMFGFIFRAPRVDSEVLCAGIAGYLMLALLWSFAYTLVANVIPDSFVFSAGPVSDHAMKGFTALYFSFVTLCTVGYGDIVPVLGMARALAMMEAAVGVFYIATIISRLVAVYSSKEKSNDNVSC
jgi:hypothetical protein